MKIPWVKPYITEEELNEVIDTIKSKWISKGLKVEKFENLVKEIIGSKYCIAVNSGTSALDVALKVIDIQPEDEVIVPAFTYIASANSILYQHAIPVFVDINPKTFTIDLEDIKRKITPRTKAIIAVDYAGQGSDYKKLREILFEKNIKIIEDAAPSFGGEQNGEKLGTFGDIGITSFHTAKTFTSAEGGMIFTDNEEYAKRARIILNQGEDPKEKYHHPVLGHNYRMTDVHASIGIAQLKRYSEVLNKRAELARYYTKRINQMSDEITTPYVENGNKHSWFLYPILLNNRDEIKKELQKRGIETNISWPLAIYQQPYFTKYKIHCPVTEDITKKILCLPLYYEMTLEEQDYVIENLIESVKQLEKNEERGGISIGGKIIDENSPTFIIAEAGVNHATKINGIYQKSIERARRLIDAAIDGGADAIKFQTFNPQDLILHDALSAKYHKENMGGDHNWFESLEKESLSKEDFQEIISYCKSRNIIFLSTPYDFKSVDLLEELNVPAYKIASSDTNNIPLIRHIAKKGKPIILSTGMATLEEIEEGIKSIKEEKNDKIILLQCVANYPINIEECNLKVMKTLEKKFNCLVGYSDHSLGDYAPLIAVAAGAKIIEKHITLNKDDFGPDHRISLEPYELKKMVERIREIEKILGKGVKQPSYSEIDNIEKLRKSIVSTEDIKTGEIITKEMISIKRPGTGLPPKYLEKIIGKKTKLDIEKDKIIKYEDIEWL